MMTHRIPEIAIAFSSVILLLPIQLLLTNGYLPRALFVCLLSLCISIRNSPFLYDEGIFPLTTSPSRLAYLYCLMTLAGTNSVSDPLMV